MTVANHDATQKLIESHSVEGRMKPGEEIGLKIDQTLSWPALIESRRNRSNDWYHAKLIGAGQGPFISPLWRTSS